jgi:hypothetical protein
MKRLTNIFILCALVAILFSSCTKETELSSTSVGDGKAVVNVSYQIADMHHSVVSNVLGRAMSDAAVADLYVLIFDSNGYLIGRQYTDGSPTSVTVNNARVANGCTVYAFANTHSAAYFNGVTSISLLNTFLSNNYQTIANAAALGAQDNLWMMGKKTGVNIVAGSNTIAATDMVLYRYNAKIELNVTCNNNIKVAAYQLIHVPLKSAITEGVPTANVTGATYADFDKVTLDTEAASLANVPFYILPNYAGTNTNSDSFDKRFSKYAPADASYIRLWLHGNGWRSTVDVYLGGSTATDYTNYNVNRNTIYKYTITVDGPGLGYLNVTFDDRPDIGDYYYKDGTWGPLALKGSKIPIGVVFSNQTSANDKLHNWTHGYAISLTNANGTTGITWGTQGTTSQYQRPSGYSATNASTSINGNLDGYTESHYIKSHQSISSSNYAAFYYALNYGTTTTGTSQYAAPTNINNSGWFLPSSGQLYNLIVNLGKINPIPSLYDSAWLNFYGTGIGSTLRDNVNFYITAVSGGVGIDLMTNSSSINSYWSSSESNTQNAFSLHFWDYGSGQVYLGAQEKNQASTQPRSCRAAIAF